MLHMPTNNETARKHRNQPTASKERVGGCLQTRSILQVTPIGVFKTATEDESISTQDETETDTKQNKNSTNRQTWQRVECGAWSVSSGTYHGGVVFRYT